MNSSESIKWNRVSQQSGQLSAFAKESNKTICRWHGHGTDTDNCHCTIRRVIHQNSRENRGRGNSHNSNREIFFVFGTWPELMLMSTATFGTLCGFFDWQFFKIVNGVIEAGNWYRVKAELSAALSLSLWLFIIRGDWLMESPQSRWHLAVRKNK